MRTTHGYGYDNGSNPTYSKYQAMKQRCLNPKHKSFVNYGGRGVKVCSRWLNSFENFLADMGEAPEGKSIDRKDSSGDYEPDNCKWSDAQEQNENRRTNVAVSIDGVEYLTLKLAAKAYGLSYGTVRVRTATYGWPVERALKTPIDKKKRRKDLQ